MRACSRRRHGSRRDWAPTSVLELLESALAHLPSLLESSITLFAVVFGGVIRGFAGFGPALVIVPIVALVYDPKTAVVLHTLIEIPGVL
ncbi:MAG: hypothetical protein VW405_18935 [Rhodospirillaceae bacterium]